MPFESLTPHRFTLSAIRIFAPPQSGLYGMSNSREWIYIGIADNIQEALLAHLAAPQSSLMQREPTGFVFEVCDGPRRPARQDRLVLEYEPTCNRRSSERF
jgi:hypothetical protein